jgi:hypothetical protein
MYIFSEIGGNLGERKTFIGVVSRTIFHVFRGAVVEGTRDTTRWVGVDERVFVIGTSVPVLLTL